MDRGFVGVLRKIVEERGKEVLLDSAKCRAFLADYTGTDYKKERRLISFAAESGVPKAIVEADDLALCRQRQIMILGEEHFLKEETAAAVFDALALVLRGGEKTKAFCKSCGRELLEEWERCPYCPAPAVPPAAPASGLPPAAPPGTGAGVKPGTATRPEPGEAATPGGRKKNGRKALIAALAGVVLVLALVLTNRPGVAPVVEVAGAVPVIELVRVEGGSFRMGYCPGGQHETPIRTVTVSGFYMGRFPVTQGEWYDVMGTWPGYFTGTNARDDNRNEITVTPAFDRRNLPVESVSWHYALVFSNRLSVMRGLSPAYSIGGSTNPDDWGLVPWGFWGDAVWDTATIVPGSNGYRLPTEAQWEFAARGGTVCRGNFVFSGSDTVGDVAWHFRNSGGRTHEVGRLRPNALGLFDMSGNVWEWVWDQHGAYSGMAERYPMGPLRVIRGGSWSNTPDCARSADRFNAFPGRSFNFLGFRVVRP